MSFKINKGAFQCVNGEHLYCLVAINYRLKYRVHVTWIQLNLSFPLR